LEKNSGKWSILDVFGAKSEENDKFKNPRWKKYLTASKVTR
jgi:hypothetical protein